MRSGSGSWKAAGCSRTQKWREARGRRLAFIPNAIIKDRDRERLLQHDGPGRDGVEDEVWSVRALRGHLWVGVSGSRTNGALYFGQGASNGIRIRPPKVFFSLPIRILTTCLLISSASILALSLLCADCRRFLAKDLFLPHSPGILLIPSPLAVISSLFFFSLFLAARLRVCRSPPSAFRLPFLTEIAYIYLRTYKHQTH